MQDFVFCCTHTAFPCWSMQMAELGCCYQAAETVCLPRWALSSQTITSGLLPGSHLQSLCLASCRHGRGDRSRLIITPDSTRWPSQADDDIYSQEKLLLLPLDCTLIADQNAELDVGPHADSPWASVKYLVSLQRAWIECTG